MFLPEHAIWKFCDAADRLDDWLPHAEWLIEKWATQGKIEVGFELMIAALLLTDGLLPASAYKAFANAVLLQIDEANANKVLAESLGSPKKRGRKQISKHEKFHRHWAVKSLIDGGMTASEAYKEVGERYCKAPDTIRREYERVLKKRSK